jgi:hypothetical protein
MVGSYYAGRNITHLGLTEKLELIVVRRVEFCGPGARVR